MVNQRCCQRAAAAERQCDANALIFAEAIDAVRNVTPGGTTADELTDNTCSAPQAPHLTGRLLMSHHMRCGGGSMRSIWLHVRG
eukprot:COSAG01_NODE_281_length_19504_cov_129.173124_24_plen_84_part_00